MLIMNSYYMLADVVKIASSSQYATADQDMH